jgi:hypothetical protein
MNAIDSLLSQEKSKYAQDEEARFRKRKRSPSPRGGDRRDYERRDYDRRDDYRGRDRY